MKTCLIAIYLNLSVIGAILANADHFTSLYPFGGPKVVALGMSELQFTQAMPTAIKQSQFFESVSTERAETTYVELRNDFKPKCAIWYRFKAGILRGFSVTAPFKAAEANVRRSYVQRILGEIPPTMVREPPKKAIRSDGLTGFEVTAYSWRANGGTPCILMVCTNVDVSTMVFDSRHFSDQDFLVPPDAKAAFMSNGNTIREKLRIAGKEVVEAVPIVSVDEDLLAVNSAPSGGASVTTPVEHIQPGKGDFSSMTSEPKKSTAFRQRLWLLALFVLIATAAALCGIWPKRK